jgi:LmbE family N-acetylglucosaminyl deacetylase
MITLVIAAHPDDEVLGCGGTIARLVNEGQKVYIAILGEGMTSRYNQHEQVEVQRVEVLHSDAHKIAQFLGAKEAFLFNLPDNRFDSVPMLEVVKILEVLLAQLKPAIVFTQHGGDLNIDHVVTYRATLTATRPMAGQSVKKVYAYEVASSTEWAFSKFAPSFVPNTFFDIGDTLENKIMAMQMYESEKRVFPHPRSPEALRAIAQRWGSVVGVQAAEAFELVRGVE